MNDHDFNPGPDLSPAGEARRESMLADLRIAMTARRRRRTAARVGIAATVLLAAAASALTLVQRPAPISVSANSSPNAAAAPVFKVTLVATDPTTLTRFSVTAPKLVRTIGDDELLALAAADGSSYGLIRTAEGARLVANQPIAGSDPQ